MCKCNCGNEKIVIESQLKSGKTKSCGCLRELTGNKHHSFKGYKDISGEFWNQIKYNAKNRNIEFDITIEYVWSLFEKQNGKCKLSGINIYFSKNYKEKGNISLDRIDNTKGYIKGNVQWLHKHVNMMKSTYNEQYFINLCQQISNNINNGDQNEFCPTT